MGHVPRIASLSLGVAVILGCGPPPGPGDAGAGATDAFVDDGALAADANLDGGPGATCRDENTAFCTAAFDCSREAFVAGWEDVPHCVESLMNDCLWLRGIPFTNGITDPAGCIAQDQAGCDEFWAAGRHPSCLPLPGDVPQGGACGVDEQCGMGTDALGAPVRLYCYRNRGLVCMDGTCEAPDLPMTGRDACEVESEDHCDLLAGYRCTAELDLSAPDHLDPRGRTCLLHHYGTAGAGCARGSDHSCVAGLFCDEDSGTCLRTLRLGETCDPADSRCDQALTSSCGDDGSGRFVCLGYPRALIGEPCGLIAGEQRVCTGAAFCNDETPSVCEERFPLGATCSRLYEDCRADLRCIEGTCQEQARGTCE